MTPDAESPLVSLGYMAKRVVKKLDWLASQSIEEICSVSNCISTDFCDFTNCWKHNPYWLFDSPSTIAEVAQELKVNMKGVSFFYYQAYPFEFEETNRQWREIGYDHTALRGVEQPRNFSRLGYDVATFSASDTPECSPLSCNGLADELAVNKHCLFNKLNDAFQSLEEGRFANSEPGPMRIYAVNRVDPRS